MKVSFAEPYLEELRIAHVHVRDKKSADRIKAVLLISDDYSFEEVAKILLLDDSTVRRHVGNFQARGLNGLLETHYQGGLARLTAAQEQDLDSLLRSNIYTSSRQIVDLVENSFGVKYSSSGVIELLHRLGFSYKKPVKIPGKLDLSAQEQFVEEYETFKKSKGEHDKIYFLDGVHPQHNTTPSYGWFPKGEETPLKTNSGRQRLSFHGALEPDSLEVFVREDDSVNAQSTIALLKELEFANPLAKTILVYTDNARYYHAKEVKKFVNSSPKIELRFLPPYSPNLNPIERLWKLFKETVIYNKYYEQLLDFKQACRSFFYHIDDYHAQISSLISSELQTFAVKSSQT